MCEQWLHIVRFYPFLIKEQMTTIVKALNKQCQQNIEQVLVLSLLFFHTIGESEE